MEDSTGKSKISEGKARNPAAQPCPAWVAGRGVRGGKLHVREGEGGCTEGGEAGRVGRAGMGVARPSHTCTRPPLQARNRVLLGIFTVGLCIGMVVAERMYVSRGAQHGGASAIGLPRTLAAGLGGSLGSGAAAGAGAGAAASSAASDTAFEYPLSKPPRSDLEKLLRQVGPTPGRHEEGAGPATARCAPYKARRPGPTSPQAATEGAGPTSRPTCLHKGGEPAWEGAEESCVWGRRVRPQ
jgi:hypothetical protein